MEVAAILEDGVLHAEVKLVAPALRELAKGAPQEAIKEALKSAVLVYGVGEAARSPAYWARYYKALADLPLEALRSGLDDYDLLPTSEHFPKPGPLRKLALKRAEPIYRATARATRAANSIPRRTLDKGTPEEREALRASIPSLRPVDAGVKFSGDDFRELAETAPPDPEVA